MIKRGVKLMTVLIITGFMMSSCSQEQKEVKAASLGKPDFTVDVVVVGAGAAGLSAATQASQLGLDVILLEKNGYPGGTTIMAEGVFAVDSHMQKEAGVEIDKVDLFTRVQNYNHWLSDSKILQKFFDSSADSIEWLEDLGVKFMGVISMGDSVQTWHIYEGLGEGFVKSMHKAALNAGVNLMLETSGKDLVMEEGSVKGLIAETSDGDKLSIEAPVVILATGGYSDNPEMMAEYVGVTTEKILQAGFPGRTGDGINMGISAGAETYYLGTTMFYGGHLEGIHFGNHLYAASAFQPTMVLINQDGERFMDESIAGTNFSFSGNAMKNQKRIISILDKASLDYFVNEGCIMGAGAYTLPGAKLTDLYSQIDEQLKSGKDNILIADTITELSSLIGIDSETLEATMERYNSSCEAGYDKSFGKTAEFLRPMTSGPWYAFDLSLGYFTTVGGLKVNEKTQVLTKAGDTIPGLYAIGTDSNGIYGDSYDVVISAGSCQGWAVNSGRFAAQDAALYLKK